MGTTRLKRVQIGKETTWGTLVPATAIVEGLQDAGGQQDQTVEQLDSLGSFAPSQYIAETKRAAKFDLSQQANYEQLGYWFDGIFGTASPTGTGPYTSSWAGYTTSAPSPRLFSVEYGTGTDIYSFAGVVLDTLGISINGYEIGRAHV